MEESGRGLPNSLEMKQVTAADARLNGAVDDLLTVAFEVPQSEGARASYYDDFPIWRPGSSPQASLFSLVNAQGDPLGCAGVRVGEIRSSEGRPIRVGLVGAVATQPEARGSGVATRLMQHCIQQARSHGCLAVVLWDSSGSSLYKRLGFRDFGTQNIVRLSAFAGNAVPADLDSVRRGWEDGLFPLLKNRSSGLALHADDLKWFRLHKNTEWYSIWDRGRPVAACAIGRGIDLQGVVHEWHGPAGKLQRLFLEVLKDHPGPCWLDRTRAISRLRRTGSRWV